MRYPKGDLHGYIWLRFAHKTLSEIESYTPKRDNKHPSPFLYGSPPSPPPPGTEGEQWYYCLLLDLFKLQVKMWGFQKVIQRSSWQWAAHSRLGKIMFNLLFSHGFCIAITYFGSITGKGVLILLKAFELHGGRQGWRHGEGSSFPPIWPSFCSQTQWGCWFSTLLQEVFSGTSLIFPFPQKPTCTYNLIWVRFNFIWFLYSGPKISAQH